MTKRYCYWSVADGDYVPMLARAIESARRVGVFKDFHVWTDRPVPGAVNHRLGKLDKRFGLFKIRMLREKVKRLNYDYFVWLDADSWFVRHPGDVLRVLQRSPVHVALESDASATSTSAKRWYGCRLREFAELARHEGTPHRSVFTCNGGLYIVHRDAIDTFCDLAADFFIFCYRRGHTGFREETALAYAMQMLCGDPHLHTLQHTSDLWAPDRAGTFRNRPPHGRPWRARDPFSGQTYPVDPAILHLLKSRKWLGQPNSPSGA